MPRLGRGGCNVRYHRYRALSPIFDDDSAFTIHKTCSVDSPSRLARLGLHIRVESHSRNAFGPSTAGYWADSGLCFIKWYQPSRRDVRQAGRGPVLGDRRAAGRSRQEAGHVKSPASKSLGCLATAFKSSPIPKIASYRREIEMSVSDSAAHGCLASRLSAEISALPAARLSLMCLVACVIPPACILRSVMVSFSLIPPVL